MQIRSIRAVIVHWICVVLCRSVSCLVEATWQHQGAETKARTAWQMSRSRRVVTAARSTLTKPAAQQVQRLQAAEPGLQLHGPQQFSPDCRGPQSGPSSGPATGLAG